MTTTKQQTMAQLLGDANKIFNDCIAEHGDWLKDYMYMHTDNEGLHWFKNIISRRYVAIKAS